MEKTIYPDSPEKGAQEEPSWKGRDCSVRHFEESERHHKDAWEPLRGSESPVTPTRLSWAPEECGSLRAGRSSHLLLALAPSRPGTWLT